MLEQNTAMKNQLKQYAAGTGKVSNAGFMYFSIY